MSIEDKLAIHEIIARYSHTYDGQDAEGFAELFVEDGIFEVFVESGDSRMGDTPAQGAPRTIQ
jgi:hypothetical protein